MATKGYTIYYNYVVACPSTRSRSLELSLRKKFKKEDTDANEHERQRPPVVKALYAEHYKPRVYVGPRGFRYTVLVIAEVWIKSNPALKMCCLALPNFNRVDNKKDSHLFR